MPYNPYDPDFGNALEEQRRQALAWMRAPVYPAPQMDRQPPYDYGPPRWPDMPTAPQMDRRNPLPDGRPVSPPRWSDMPTAPQMDRRNPKQDALRQMAEERERWQRLPRALEKPDDLDDRERDAMKRQLLDAYKRLSRQRRADQMRRLMP